MSNKLIVLLERSQFDGRRYVKAGASVDLGAPLQFHTGSFTPTAVVVHHGPSPHCGHYTAWVKRNGERLHFDDDKPGRHATSLPSYVGCNAVADEDLLDDCDLVVHPLIGTATYFTDAGAPLMIFDQPTLEMGSDGPQRDEPRLRGDKGSEIFVAFPRRNLHVAFDGQLLHGVPGSLEEVRGERLALLVNVWVHHRPIGLKPLGTGKGTPPATSNAGPPMRFRKRKCPDTGKELKLHLGQWQLDGLRPGLRTGKVDFKQLVTSAASHQDSVELHCNDAKFRCSRCVFAMPPVRLGDIHFTPQLPASRTALHGSNFIGCIIKSVFRYERPFWRLQGFSGEVVAEATDEAPCFNCYDHCLGDRYFLVCFMNGAPAQTWSQRSQEERRAVLLQQLTKWFGPEAKEALEYIEKDWAADEFTKGCPVGCYPPNTLAPHMQALRTPCGVFHWAGTEAAERCQGFMEGAVDAAKRAVKEVTQSLAAASLGGGGSTIYPHNFLYYWVSAVLLVLRTRQHLPCDELWLSALLSLGQGLISREIDLAAHVGGTVSGALVAYLWGPRYVWSWGGLLLRSAAIINWPFV
eukprot:s419_g20.t1